MGCDASCDEGFACLCGVCTRACSESDQCGSLASGASCVSGSERSCRKDADAHFCDLSCEGDADCTALGESFSCQNGYCREAEVAPVVCPETTLEAGDNERAVVVGGTTRTYVVRLPTRFAGTGPVPLVLDFHTLGGTSASEAEASGYAELAEQEGFIVAWPQGIDGAWNVGPCCTTSPDVDDVAFARAVVQQIQSEACIDAKRVYAVGVANGGGMAYELACNAADVFSGVAPSAFDLLEESQQPCDPTRPVTVISFRGTADPVVSYAGGPQPSPADPNVTMNFLGAVGTFERWAELDQCTGTSSEADENGCSTYSECAGGVEVTLCTTEDGLIDWGDPQIAWATLSRHSLP
jgi:polyhydroxybutyrate depolymerase